MTWIILLMYAFWQPVGSHYQVALPEEWHGEDGIYSFGETEITIESSKRSFPEGAQWSEPQSFGGFAGMLWEEIGEEQSTLFWALELAPQYRIEMERVTIQAIGPPDEIAREKERITRFARSFQLTNALPEPL